MMLHLTLSQLSLCEVMLVTLYCEANQDTSNNIGSVLMESLRVPFHSFSVLY